jgi:hypothetical protein
MGNFYVNHTVRAPQERVAALLEREGRTAFVGPTAGGYTVVCDRECDYQDPAAITDLGRRLSALLNGPVLAVLNHDDDVLCYWLFERGQLTEQYNSCPDYFDDDEDEDFGVYFDEDDDEEGESGDGRGSAPGAELCRAFGRPEVSDRVRSILNGPHALFAMETHQNMVSTLGLPVSAVGTGYKYLAEGDAGLSRDDCVHVGRHAGVRRGWDPADDEEE